MRHWQSFRNRVRLAAAPSGESEDGGGESHDPRLDRTCDRRIGVDRGLGERRRCAGFSNCARRSRTRLRISRPWSPPRRPTPRPCWMRRGTSSTSSGRACRASCRKLSIRGMGFDRPPHATGDRPFERPSGLRHRASALARASRARPEDPDAQADARMNRSRLNPSLLVLARSRSPSQPGRTRRTGACIMLCSRARRPAAIETARRSQKAKRAIEQSVAEVRAQFVEARSRLSAGARARPKSTRHSP